MNDEIKTRWVAALRDPATQQTQFKLGRTDGSRCCLGVLCDLAVQDGVIGLPTVTVAPENPTGDEDVLLFDDVDNLPSDTVYKWSGLTREFAEALAEMNDTHATFAQIADAVEAGQTPDSDIYHYDDEPGDD